MRFRVTDIQLLSKITKKGSNHELYSESKVCVFVGLKKKMELRFQFYLGGAQTFALSHSFTPNWPTFCTLAMVSI